MHWTPTRLLSLRFFTMYFILYCLSSQFITSGLLAYLWEPIVLWLGEGVLELPEIYRGPSGSGDGVFAYVQLLLFFLLSLLGTLAWSWFDRERIPPGKILEWLEVLVRYYLALQMLIYGLAKVYYIQFQEPSFARLVQPFGEASPMGLLWTFMGFSKGYTIFAGWGETIGALLLFSRRTRMLGALVVLGVMGNVMAMNFFYDVPVKIHSTHLVMMAIGLLLLDAPRLWSFFVQNEAVAPTLILPHFKNPRLERAKDITKIVLVSLVMIGSLVANFTIATKVKTPSEDQVPLYGLYESQSFTENGIDRPLLVTDTSHWQYLILERPELAQIRQMNGKSQRYDLEVDTLQQQLIFQREEESPDTLYYSEPDSSSLILEGLWQTDSIWVRFTRKTKDDFLLMHRGFHWVTEQPFNR